MGIFSSIGSAAALAFGPEDKIPKANLNFRIDTPQFNIRRGEGSLKLARGAEGQKAAGLRSSLLGDLAGLQSQVRPGFGRLTQAAKKNTTDTFGKRRGNLRGQLARRRVLGSSFGEAEESSLALEEAQALEAAESRSLLQEIDASANLIDQQFKQTATAMQEDLQALGFLTGMQNTITSVLSDQAAIDKDIAVKQAQGRGKLFGDIFGGLDENSGQAAKLMAGGG